MRIDARFLMFLLFLLGLLLLVLAALLARYRALAVQARGDLRKAQELASRLEVERNYAQVSASIDGLTGLANRRAFDDVMSTEFYRLKRSGGSLAVVMFDVDRFKLYNDRFGHPAGDECLRRLGREVKGCFQRAADFGARYGGEEFVVVLPDTGLEGALVMAERVRRLVEGLGLPHPDNPPHGRVTVSLGVAARDPLRMEGWEPLLELADTALYQAKRAGRNRVVPSPEEASAGAGCSGLIRLVWRQSAECGHPRVDGQHRELFEQANRLLSALVEGRPPEVCAGRWVRLVEEVRNHFRDEEALLAEVAYPDAAQHARIHADLLARAAELQAAYGEGRLALGDLFSFLAYEMVAQHLFQEDRKFFPYLAGACRAESGRLPTGAHPGTGRPSGLE